MQINKPIIGITAGDPCGIGAEIIVKAIATERLADRATMFSGGRRGDAGRASLGNIAVLSMLAHQDEAIRQKTRRLVRRLALVKE